MRVFVAGATGALGKPFVPLLVARGYDVFGMTKSPEKSGDLLREGAQPVVVDALDAHKLYECIKSADPEIVVHVLTDLPFGTPSQAMVEGTLRNARMRHEGTRNLVAAALGSGVRKMIASSIAWVYAHQKSANVEDDVLDLDAEEPRRTTVRGVADLEELVLHSPPLSGVVVRMGHLYGPGTGHDKPDDAIAVSVDAAVSAMLLALDADAEGVFNIVEDNDLVTNSKARTQLGWRPEQRIAVC